MLFQGILLLGNEQSTPTSEHKQKSPLTSSCMLMRYSSLDHRWPMHCHVFFCSHLTAVQLSCDVHSWLFQSLPQSKKTLLFRLIIMRSKQSAQACTSFCWVRRCCTHSCSSEHALFLSFFNAQQSNANRTLKVNLQDCILLLIAALTCQEVKPFVMFDVSLGALW